MLQEKLIIQDDGSNILHLKKEVRMIVEMTKRSSNGKNLCGWGGQTGSRNCRVENLQMEQGNDCDSIVQQLSQTSTKTCQHGTECIERRMKLVEQDVWAIDKKMSDISR